MLSEFKKGDLVRHHVWRQRLAIVLETNLIFPHLPHVRMIEVKWVSNDGINYGGYSPMIKEKNLVKVERCLKKAT
jgi:hypothetical protein